MQRRLFLAALLLITPYVRAELAPIPKIEALPEDPVESWRRTVVASVLVLEAGGDGERGMEAVMHVIANRVEANGSTPYAEVVKRRQFATMARGSDYAVRRARSRNFSDVLPEALAIYDRWKSGNLGYDFTLGSTHFESYTKTPYAFRKLTPTIRVGGNRFYK